MRFGESVSSSDGSLFSKKPNAWFNSSPRSLRRAPQQDNAALADPLNLVPVLSIERSSASTHSISWGVQPDRTIVLVAFFSHQARMVSGG